MKKLLISSIAAVFISALSSCSGWFDDCGPFDEGYNWEKKEQITSIPFYPDSLASDSITIRLIDLGDSPDSVKVIYSSTIDSFRVTADAFGTNFTTLGADTAWKPTYRYLWGIRQMDINLTNYKTMSTIKTLKYRSVHHSRLNILLLLT